MCERALVSLSFQVSADAKTVKRKKILSFDSGDTLQLVYETISGRFGSTPLWPQDFGKLVTEGQLPVQLFHRDGNAKDKYNLPWIPALASAMLCELVPSSGQRVAVDLLLCITEPDEVEQESQSSVQLQYSNTFLNIKGAPEDNEPPCSKANSDRGTPNRSLPRSRDPLEAGNFGAINEQASKQQEHRRVCEDYMKHKLCSFAMAKYRVGSSQVGRGGSSVDLPLQCESPGPPPPIERELETAEGQLFDPLPHVPPPIDPALLDSTEQTGKLFHTLSQPIAVDAADVPLDTVLLQKPVPKPKSHQRSDSPMVLPLPSPAPEILGVRDVNEDLVDAATRRRFFSASSPVVAAMVACTPGATAPSSQLDAQVREASTSESNEDLRPSGMRQKVQDASLITGLAVRKEEDDMMQLHLLRAMPSNWQIRQAPGMVSPLLSGTAGMLPATYKSEELFDAVSRYGIGMVKELLASRMDVNAYTSRGSHILFRAIIKARDLEILHLLLSHNANVRSADERGNQAMHFWTRATAGRHALLDIGRLLLNAGADPNPQRNDDGMSPLHHVVTGHNNRRGWQDFHKALFLVRNGANIFLSTKHGQFPCTLISPDGRKATKQMTQLLTHGISPGGFPGSWPTCECEGCPWCM